MKDDAIATTLVRDWAEKEIETPSDDNFDYDAVKQEVATHLEDFISDAISRTESDCEALAEHGKQEVVDEITDSLGELLDRILGSDEEGILEVLQNADVRSRIIDVEGRLGEAVTEQIETQLESHIEVQTQGWKSVSITMEVEPVFVMSRNYSKDPWGLVAALERLHSTAEDVAERVKSERLPQRLDAALARLREAVLASPYAEEDVRGVESYAETTVAEIEASARARRERQGAAAGEQGLPTLDPVGDAVADAARAVETDAIVNEILGKGV